MRRLLPAVLLAAGLVLAAARPGPAAPVPVAAKAPPDKWEKGVRPSLTAKSWVKRPSGLEVWDAKAGAGDPVPAGATVTVHYTGWLTDEAGTVFDSSVKRGDPVAFPLAAVIAGWQEGVPGMKPGGVRLLKVPAALAYGEGGAGKIPPNATLVFEVELIGAK